MKLNKILHEKHSLCPVISIFSDESLLEAAKIMIKHKLGALLCREPKSDPPVYRGILTKTDILAKACLGEDLKNVTAAQAMTHDMIVATIDDDVHYILQVMTRHKFTHMPVIEKGNVAGIVSIEDIMRSTVEHDEITIHHLSDFLGGTYGNKVY